MMDLRQNLAETGTILQPQRQTQYSELSEIIRSIEAEELPDETTNEFSSAPYDFEESAKILWEDTQLTYYHTCTANRFSENYLKLCRLLEKNIRQTGSLCLTKTVLEQQGVSFPELDNMRIEEMVGMVSYHLRKCHAAFQKIYQENNLLGTSYLGWEFRWVSLGNRLKATEVKIQKIRDGKINIETMLRQAQTFQKTSHTNDDSVSRIVKSLRANPNALPMKGSLTREMLRIKTSAEEMQKKQKDELADLFSIWGKPDMGLINSLLSGKDPYTKSQNGFSKKNHSNIRTSYTEQTDQIPAQGGHRAGKITEAEVRRTLIDRAMEKGDQKALQEIPLEDTAKLYERWLNYAKELDDSSREIATRNTLGRSRSGPDEVIRKKLREKRKKKKR